MAPYTGTEAVVFSMTLVLRPRQQRRAQWLSKYIKATLGRSGPGWVKTSLAEIPRSHLLQNEGSAVYPIIGGNLRIPRRFTSEEYQIRGVAKSQVVVPHFV
jgi:hypothetical protein